MMRETFRPRWLLTAVLAASLVPTPGAGQTKTQPPNPDIKLVEEFMARVKKYVDLHKKLEATLAPLPASPTPDQTQQHQQALERLISRARAGAKPGELFTDPVRAYFRRQVSRVFSGPDGAAALASIMDENPRTIRLQVNSRYPDGVPFTNMPPRLLLVLPNLPPELEYRFVGDRLILLDTHATIVVDFIERAITV